MNRLYFYGNYVNIFIKYTYLLTVNFMYTPNMCDCTIDRLYVLLDVVLVLADLKREKQKF